MKKLPNVFSTARPAKSLREQLPSATAPKKRGGGGGSPLQLVLPAELVRALKVAAAEQGTTVRHLVLKALVSAGWKVPTGEMGDRRTRGG
jgi:hypothetical protein